MTKDHDLTRAEIDEALDMMGPAFPPGDTKAVATDATLGDREAHCTNTTPLDASAEWRPRHSPPESARGADRQLDDHGVAFAVHPIIPSRPSIVLVVADIGSGKTSLLCHVAATLSRAGKQVLYIVGEGNPKEDIAPLITAGGGDLQHVTLVDCVVEHADMQLDNLLSHKGVAPHLAGADCIILDPLTAFESEGVKRHKIRQRLKQFHRQTRNGVMVFIATHPNRTRTVRRPVDLVPSGWAGNVEIVWQIEPSDQNGNAVLEMTRGRYYALPWKRYTYWISANSDGTPVAVITDEPSPSIADLLRERAPNHVPPSVAKARLWLLDYLEQHGDRLVETQVFPDGKIAGHSEPALVKAKAMTSEIGHTPQGHGPSKWFLKADEQTQRTQQDKRDGRIRELGTLPPDGVVAVRPALARMSDSVESVTDEQTRPLEPPTVARKLRRVRVPLSEAHAFTEKYHRYLDGARANAKYAIGLKDETGDLVAVLTAGRPSDCKTNQDTILELSRVATKDNIPNACSILISVATKVAVFLGCERVQTFTLPDEDGTSYRACGFRFDGCTQRSGRKDDPYPRKKRWVKDLPLQWHKSKKKSRGRGDGGGRLAQSPQAEGI